MKNKIVFMIFFIIVNSFFLSLFYTNCKGAEGLTKDDLFSSLPIDEDLQRKHFTDLPLVSHEGKPIRFYDDMLKDKIVLVNFIFTNCSTACPNLCRTFVSVQDMLGEKLGRDVFMITITVDPERDTPVVLKKYAERLNAKKGWTFLTGKKENVDWVIYKLGQYKKDYVSHSPIFVLGNVRNGKWTRLLGSASPQEIVSLVNVLAED